MSLNTQLFRPIFALVLAVFFLSFGFNATAAKKGEYYVQVATENFVMSELFTEALARKGVKVTHKTLVIPNGDSVIHLSVQDYSLIKSKKKPSGDGILFGHGMISNSAEWLNHIKLALDDGMMVSTVIWPGHGLMFEPKALGAMRSYVPNAEIGDHNPEAWIDAVGPVINHYMKSRTERFAYWGHSMGDMLASEMNHRGYLQPDFQVMMGGPVSTEELGKLSRTAARVTRANFSISRQLVTLSDELVFSALPIGGIVVPESADGNSYDLIEARSKVPSILRATLMRKPSMLAMGTLNKDFLDWAMTSAIEGYAWEGNDLKTDTLFIYGSKEQFPASSIQETYPERGRNIWWAQLELVGADHIGEASPESALASWKVFKQLFKGDKKRPKKGHRYTAQTPKSGSTVRMMCQKALL